MEWDKTSTAFTREYTSGDYLIKVNNGFARLYYKQKQIAVNRYGSRSASYSVKKLMRHAKRHEKRHEKRHSVKVLCVFAMCVTALTLFVWLMLGVVF